MGKKPKMSILFLFSMVYEDLQALEQAIQG